MIARWSRAGLLGAAVLVTALRGGSYDVIPRHHLFVLVWWLLALGSLLGVLPRARPRTGLLVAAGALALLAAWTAVGLSWTESAERTSAEVARTLGLSGVLLLVGASFDRDDRRAAIAAVTGAAAVVCVLAFASRLAPDVLTSKLTEAGYQPRRLSYALNYWNAVGVWAAMTVALALGAGAHAGRWWLRAAALAVLPVAGAVAYLTYSRTAVIALAAGVVVVVGLSPRRWLAAVHVLVGALGAAAVIAAIRAHPGIADASGTSGAGTVALVAVAASLACAGAAWVTGGGRLEGFALPVATARRVLALAGVIGVALLVLFGPGAASQAWDSFNRPLANPSGDLSSRLGSLSGERRRLWAVALDAFEREPVTGTGAGTYELVWNRDLRRSEQVRDAHSLYLEMLAELGVVGALLLAAALGALALAAARGALARGPDRGVAAGCAGALVVFCLAAGVDWMWESTAVVVTALTCGALACAGDPAAPARARRRVAGLVVGLLAIATLLPGLIASTQLRGSEEDIRRGRPEPALEKTAAAIGIQPWGASGYVQRALVLERLGLLREAAADARRATRKEPTDWQHWLLLARIEAERGRIPEALRSAGRARELNPRAPAFRRRR